MSECRNNSTKRGARHLEYSDVPGEALYSFAQLPLLQVLLFSQLDHILMKHHALERSIIYSNACRWFSYSSRKDIIYGAGTEWPVSHVCWESIFLLTKSPLVFSIFSKLPACLYHFLSYQTRPDQQCGTHPVPLQRFILIRTWAPALHLPLSVSFINSLAHKNKNKMTSGLIRNVMQ